MALRQVLGVAGGIVGSFFGFPQLGFVIGSALGNAFDPQVIKGPAIGDIAQQTAQEGGPIPIVFALSPPMGGNIIASGPPRKVKKSKRQGKGGPKVETESVFRTYGIGVCEGPIKRFVRVWRNGELVYDIRSDTNYYDPPGGSVADHIARLVVNNGAWLDKVTFYLGTYTQNADPDLEAVFGVGTTPAHRGIAYMVVADDDLTDLRGAIPQYTFQVDQGSEPDFETVYLEDATWEKPDGLVSVDVVVAGAGGGAKSGEMGGFAETIGTGFGGGGGGFSTATFLAADLPDTVGVVVGQGGAGGAGFTGEALVHGNVGANGGDSSFDSCTAGGGIGGNTGSAVGGDGNVEDGGAGAGSGADGADSGRGAGGGGGGGNVITLFPNEPGAGGDGSTDVVAAPGGAAGSSTSGAGIQTATSGGAGAAAADFRLGLGGGGGGGGGAKSSDSYSVAGNGGAGGFPGGGGGGGGSIWFHTATGDSTSGNGGAGGDGVVVVLHHFAADLVTLQSVVTILCARAGLPAELIDVSELEGTVRGFAVTNSYACSEAIKALGQVFLFDAAPFNGKVNFIPRGKNSIATVIEAEMVDDDTEIEQSKRGDPISIPRVMNLNYHDVLGGIATDKQTSERAGDRRATGEVQIQTAVILSADEAAQAVRINHKVMVEDQRGELKFSLSDKFIRLTPADILILQFQGRSERLRLVTVNTQDGFQEYVGLHDRQSAYESSVEGIPAAPQQLPPSNVVGPTLLQLLDIPLLKDVDDGVGLLFYVAVTGLTDAWQGATIELSYDGGANYVDAETTDVPSTMGELLTALPDHPQDFPDETHTVRIRIDTPDADLEGTTLEQLLNRANLAIIGDELIQFGNAVEVTGGQWELSYLLRGRRGSATAAHTIGARFVLLDAFTAIPASVTDLGRNMTFRATSTGTSPDTGTVVSMIYSGQAQTERAVGYLAAHRAGVNAVVNWQGVGRLGSGVTVANGARFAGFRVTFDDGVLPAVVVETDQETLTQDVSALGAPLTITVVQLNDLTGEGPISEVMLT